MFAVLFSSRNVVCPCQPYFNSFSLQLSGATIVTPSHFDLRNGGTLNPSAVLLIMHIEVQVNLYIEKGRC